MVDKVDGKVILVTGGADGIGLSYAKKLLQCGANGISIIDKDDEKGENAVRTIIEAFGPNKAIFIKADLTKLDEFDLAFKKTIDTWNTIDIVINNAGICNDAYWELEIAVNCNSLVYGSLLGLKYMGKDKGGKGGVIINTSSNLGLQPLASCPIYELLIYNRTGVKVLTICPGCTNTALVANASQFAFTALSPDMGELLVKEFPVSPGQPVENVAEGLITLITNGEHGSVWLVEGKTKLLFPIEANCRKYKM